MKKLFSVLSVVLIITSLSGAIRTIEFDVFPMAEFSPPFRYQLLAKGMDSWKNSWRVDYSWIHFAGEPKIVFHTNNGWGISARKALPPFRKSRITVVFNGKKIGLYLNGVLLAEKECMFLPPENNYTLWVGRYAASKNLLFPGVISQVQLLKKTRYPEKFTSGQDAKQVFFYQAAPKNRPAFQKLSGKWHFNRHGFGESTDDNAFEAKALLPVELPDDFVFSSGVITRDNMGLIHWEFCRRDARNSYLLTHKNPGTGIVFLTLYKKQNGKLFLLGETTSSRIMLPGNGTAAKPIFISIARKGTQIHIRVHDREVLSVTDKTFKGGKAGFILQGRKADFCRVSVTSYPEYAVHLKPVQLKPLELAVRNKTLRKVFYRDEKLHFTARFINRTPEVFSPEKVKIAFSGETFFWTPPAVPAGKTVQHDFSLSGKDLRSGTYLLTLSSGKYKADYAVTLVERQCPDHYSFTNSRHNIALSHLKQISPTLLNGSGFTLPPGTNLEHLRPAVAQANDYAMLYNMTMGLRLPMLRNQERFLQHMRIVRKDESRPPLLDAWRPDVRQYF